MSEKIVNEIDISKIKSVLDCKCFSNYFIGKKSEITPTTIASYKNKTADIANMTLLSGARLTKFYDSFMKLNEIKHTRVYVDEVKDCYGVYEISEIDFYDETGKPLDLRDLSETFIFKNHLTPDEITNEAINEMLEKTLGISVDIDVEHQ
ncbi:hypothetical protein [Listeria newyorkensis]|uniref:hypothetical protein n=1 Tax=Listeria newyorkensis TaxID=1497681 RepID=UPI00051D88F7|nr:hypothetical protein [Listeria newyorkensis]KGL43602.1 hypothetical protein EP58_07635 [Listeria newyorkensis]